MTSSKQELQQTWTVYEKTFTSENEAAAYADLRHRMERATEALKPACQRPRDDRFAHLRPNPEKIVDLMMRAPKAFTAALQILQEGA